MESALSKLKGSVIRGREIRVDRSTGKSENRESPLQIKDGYKRSNSQFSLYLGNLSWEVTDKVIEEMITDVVGSDIVTNIRLATDKETGSIISYFY